MSKRYQIRQNFLKKTLLLFVLSLTIVLLVTIPNRQDSFSPPDTPKVSSQKIETIRQTARTIYQNCLGKALGCFENQTTQKLLNVYPTDQILDALYDYDTYFSCHAFTHFIGRSLYRKLGSIADAYSQINFTCHGGTYHGVIEAYLDERKANLDNLTEDQLQKICSDSKTKTNKNPKQVYTECLHGFGHAFMFITDSDLPRSLNLCDRFEKRDQEPCFGGALMENSTSSTNLDHPTKWLKPDDKFFPCTALSEKYLNQCYFYQANYLIKISNHNYPSVFADCYNLSNSHQDYCLMGLGANLASFSNETSIENAAKVCDLAKTAARNLCIEGAIPSLMARHGGQSQKIVEFCQNVAHDLRKLCFAKFNVATQFWGYSQDQLEKICAPLDSLRQACLGQSDVKLRY